MFKISTNDKPVVVSINEFRGINLSSDNTQINDTESPDMLNFQLDTAGALTKRTGYKRVFNSLGAGAVNGQYIFNKKDGSSVEIFAHGTKLYKLDNNVPTEIYSGLANSRVRFFTMNDKCYLMDGTNYLQFDGTTVSQVTPYVPTINRLGSTQEDFNLLGNRFKQVFSPNGTDTKFTLALKNLDSSTVKASIDGGVTWNKLEGTDLTVNRTTSDVTFTVAPTPGTATLIIEAGYTDATKPLMIKKCVLRVFYGGENDTRVLISGNPDYPNRIFRSGLYDPTYWPENAFSDIGSNSEKITALTKQYDTLVVLKERSIYNMSFELDDNGEPLYPTKPINEQTGCIASSSVQIVENNPTFLTQNGVYQLIQSNVRDERNVISISEKIDKKLLDEANLQNAVSLDYDKKYMLFINNSVYVYDYMAKDWYIWDNIKANTFIVKDSLYFGSRENGIIYRLSKADEPEAYNDDGQAINAYWYSKLFDFGAAYRRKTVSRIFYAIKPDERTSMKLYTVDSTNYEKLISETRMDLFRFFPLYFQPFSFVSNSLPQVTRIKAKIKKIVYFQIKIENNTLNESLGVNSISFELVPQDYVK